MTGPLAPVRILNLIRASLGIPPDSTFPENALAAADRRLRGATGHNFPVILSRPASPFGEQGADRRLNEILVLSENQARAN